jgi:Domain of unknown function (DUF1905)
MNIEFNGKIWFWRGPDYIVPIKGSVRNAENLEEGVEVTVRLEVR